MAQPMGLVEIQRYMDDWMNQYTDSEDNAGEFMRATSDQCLGVRNLTSYSPSVGSVNVDLVPPMSFVIETRKIGHVVIQPNFNKPERGQRTTWEVVIFPKRSLGVGALTTSRPKVITFTWPDSPANSVMDGLDESELEGTTYLVMLKALLMAELCHDAPLVTDLTGLDGPGASVNSRAILYPMLGTRVIDMTAGSFSITSHGDIYFTGVTITEDGTMVSSGLPERDIKMLISRFMIKGGKYRAVPAHAEGPASTELELDVFTDITGNPAYDPVMSIKFVELQANFVRPFRELTEKGFFKFEEKV